MQVLYNLYQRKVDSLLTAVFGERFGEYRKKWYRVEEEKGGYLPEYPLNIDMESTGKCNLKCQMCPRTLSGKGALNQGLSYDEIRKVLDESEGRSYALIFGGDDEPLLDKEKTIWTFEYAKKRKFLDIFLSTNGVNLDRDIIRDLLKLKISRILVSIDAVTPATYEKIRGRDLYNKIIENINLFLKMREEAQAKVPIIRVSFVDMPVNSSEKEGFINFWKERADNIIIQEFMDLNRKRQDLSEEELRVLYNSRGVCYNPFRRLSVLEGGKLYPCCCIISGKQSLGGVKDTGLQEAWDSEYMRWMRERLKSGRFYEVPSCLKCAIATFRLERR